MARAGEAAGGGGVGGWQGSEEKKERTVGGAGGGGVTASKEPKSNPRGTMVNEIGWGGMVLPQISIFP